MNWEPYNISKPNDRYLYKFLSEENLLKFLASGDMWFSRSDKFGDKLECITVDDFVGKRFKLDQIKARQRRHLISCFHVSTNETLAFWDTYAKTESSRRKFAVRFHKNYLIKLIESSQFSNISCKGIYGNIKYKNLISADLNSLIKSKVLYASFRKDKVFNYEQEFRFVIQSKKEFTNIGSNLNIGIPASLSFDVLVNPLLEEKDFIKCNRLILKSHFLKNLKLSKLTKWVKPEWADIIEKHTTRN